MTDSSPAWTLQKEVKAQEKVSLMGPIIPTEMTPDLAEIFGIHAGDGYMRRTTSNGYELDISGNIDEKDYYDGHVVPLFEQTFGIKLKPQYFQPRNTYGFRIYKKEVCEIMHSLGFPYGKKTFSVEIPKQILESKNHEVICRFIRGVFDTDGTISFRRRLSLRYSEIYRKRHTYPNIKLSISSKNLRDGIGALLLNEGYHLALSCEIKSGSESNAYNVTLEGDKNLIKWMQEIGFKNSIKANRYLIWREFGFNPPLLTFEQQREVLSGKKSPHEYYLEKVLVEQNKLDKLVKNRVAFIQVSKVFAPKG